MVPGAETIVSEIHLRNLESVPEVELALDGVEVIDAVTWAHDHLLAILPVPRRVGTMVVHPTCSAGRLGVSAQLSAIAARLPDQVVVPARTRCCGTRT